MERNEILRWLKESDPNRLETLWKQADTIRKQNVGDQVHLRGLIEISNDCRRQCLYCGIRAANQEISRYCLSMDEVLHCAELAVQFEYGSVVIQSGENSALETDWIAEIVKKIKTKTNLAITLSLGERFTDDWKRWKDAGADRYLLRFETSDKNLYRAIHPPLKSTENSDRIEMLRQLRNIGYEIGSGIMVGIPGQSYNSLAEDILLFHKLDLDMIGLGPFLPHPHTPLGKLFPPELATGLFRPDAWNEQQKTFFSRNQIEILNLENQVSCDKDFVFKVLALTRILRPDANIPSTTAVATIDGTSGRKNGLSRGANVVMPNLTPKEYREKYEIYPNKAAIAFDPEETHLQVLKHLAEIQRVPGVGQGSRKDIKQE